MKHSSGITCGENCIISPNIRFRYPELVTIGNNCIIDDYVYISTALVLGDYSHICTGVKIIGGKNSKVELGEFCSLSPNVVVAAGGDSYTNGFASCTVSKEFKGEVTAGHILIGDNCFTGSNSVILPNVIYNDGARVGALSLVPEGTILDTWWVYAGIPIKKLKQVNKLKVEELEKAFKENLC